MPAKIVTAGGGRMTRADIPWGPILITSGPYAPGMGIYDDDEGPHMVVYLYQGARVEHLIDLPTVNVAPRDVRAPTPTEAAAIVLLIDDRPRVTDAAGIAAQYAEDCIWLRERNRTERRRRRLEKLRLRDVDDPLPPTDPTPKTSRIHPSAVPPAGPPR